MGQLIPKSLTIANLPTRELNQSGFFFITFHRSNCEPQTSFFCPDGLQNERNTITGTELLLFYQAYLSIPMCGTPVIEPTEPRRPEQVHVLQAVDANMGTVYLNRDGQNDVWPRDRDARRYKLCILSPKFQYFVAESFHSMDGAPEEKLTALNGCSITVREDDTPDGNGGANIAILFNDAAVLRACYWRMIGSDGTVLSSFDHQQQYGLPEPIDAKKQLSVFLNDQSVYDARINRKFGDLHFSFSDGTYLQIFGFSSYEVWELNLVDGTVEYSNHL